MFLCGDFLPFAFEAAEGADDAESGVPGFDDILDVALLGRLVWVVEKIFVFRLLLCQDFFGTGRVTR